MGSGMCGDHKPSWAKVKMQRCLSLPPLLFSFPHFFLYLIMLLIGNRMKEKRQLMPLSDLVQKSFSMSLTNTKISTIGAWEGERERKS